MEWASSHGQMEGVMMESGCADLRSQIQNKHAFLHICMFWICIYTHIYNYMVYTYYIDILLYRYVIICLYIHTYIYIYTYTVYNAKSTYTRIISMNQCRTKHINGLRCGKRHGRGVQDLVRLVLQRKY